MHTNHSAQALHWRINCFCNRRCPFCYGPQNKSEVAAEQAHPVLDRFLEYGIRTFILTGGEPLLSKKIDETIVYLSSRGARVVLYSNCDFFDFHEDVVARHVDTLCVPVDGASEYTHDLVRGKHNQRAVVSVLDRYANASSRLKIKVGTVVGRNNVHELRAILYLLDKYRIDIWKVYEYLRYSDRDLQKLWDKEQLSITASEYSGAVRALMAVEGRKTQISVSSEYDRESSYFMMNPDMEIIVPVRGANGIFEDRVICNATETDPERIHQLWMSNVDWDSYRRNLAASHF
jgi:MoaA/NifB/PqqE/SkfB family radical SAM enzyme